MDIVEEALCTLLGGLFLFFSIIGFLAIARRIEEYVERENRERKRPEIITLDEYVRTSKE